MSIKARVVIKIFSKSTSFLVSNDKKVVFWGTVGGGKGLIVSDVASCLRIKLSEAEQLTKAKGVCLLEAVGIKEDKLLAEIIRDRVEQLFNNMKDTLKNEGLLEKVSCFLIIRDDNYIPDMDKLLSKVMEKPAKCIDLANLWLKSECEIEANSDDI